MNTMQELLNNGLDKTTAINMFDNYTDRIGSEYGCWKHSVCKELTEDGKVATGNSGGFKN